MSTINKEVREIQKQFNCTELEAVNILLDLTARENDNFEPEKFTEKFAETLEKAKAA